ncbi:Protein of unknown function [Pyronema omphalodes CBS 100304]|uniref:Uncharacterized protein n=1 Tax=Pyronema omphalodes (strain CBS 100304) TaxID=1076935 RepID=U4LM34_PYROM|nr:Protein of unknown function [Pyronema omphalodes CBS 100304]
MQSFCFETEKLLATPKKDLVSKPAGTGTIQAAVCRVGIYSQRECRYADILVKGLPISSRERYGCCITRVTHN